MSYTQGKWKTRQKRGNNQYEYVLQINNGTAQETIAEIDFSRKDNANANSRLIAAAPELLEACKGISSSPSYEWCKILKAFAAVPMLPDELVRLLKKLLNILEDCNKRAWKCEEAIAKAKKD